MGTLQFEVQDDRALLHDGHTVLAEYVFRPEAQRIESPRPYFSPLRTRGGEVVSLHRPHDHVWHTGLAWSLPVVDDENFWGGPSYVDGVGYVQKPNNGAQVHASFQHTGFESGTAQLRETLSWVTEQGEVIFTERRTLAAVTLGDDAWMLGIEIQMTDAAGRAHSIGSPTTRGRENAGYGGLFWRGPRSFTGGSILAPGVEGGDELRGIRSPWMGFSGRHDGSGASSTIVMIDEARNVQHPPQWFARSEEYACLCPAPFFSEEHVIAPGGELTLRYGVVVADGASDPERAARLAADGAVALDGMLATHSRERPEVNTGRRERP